MKPVQRHILVVDDAADNRGLLVQLLQRRGYRVSQAADGQQALEAIAAERPDLVLLDLMMPVMDGFGVLEALGRDRWPMLPVIVVSAATEREARLRALTLGANEFVLKPFDTEELYLRVNNMLALKDANDVLQQQAEELTAANEELIMLNEELMHHNERVEREVAERTAEIERERAFSERLLQNVPAGIAYLDRELVHRVANPALLQMLGLPAEAVLGKTIGEVLPHERDRLMPKLERQFATGEPVRAVSMPLTHAVHGGPRTTYWDAVQLPVCGPTGEVEGILMLVQDVTPRVESERSQAAYVQRLEEVDRYKDEFLTIVSHELRTPLNFIMGFASILEDDELLSTAHRAYITKILAGADRMLNLVNDLLDMARIKAGKFTLEPRPTPYGEVVQAVLDTMKPLADRKAIALEATIDVAQPAMVDPQRIIQALTNLVGNAVKFTPSGGRICVRAFTRGNELVTEVQDTGVGIPGDQRAHIFEKFTQADMSMTRQAGGTGLGLPITRNLIEAHGGRIGVDSEPGEGSTFWFTLPMTPVPAAELAAERQPLG
jgi:PAS domain S-box-containing protein